LGLITKTIEKVEKEENPPAEQERPPQPRSKKRFLILAAALLFIGVSLGLGYLFLLKPGSEAPVPIARRSTSAKKKPPKLTTAESEQKKDALQAEAKPGEEESVSETSSKETVTTAEPIEETGTTGEQEEKSPDVGTVIPAVAPEGQTSEAEEEPETPQPGIVPSLGPPVSSTPDQEKDILTETSPSPDEEEASRESTSDNVAFLEEQEIPSHEVTPSYAEDLRGAPAQEPLTVREKSDSRAERYYNKGVSYQQQGESVQAIQAYRKALTYNPDHVQAHTNLAIACLQAGRLKEAEQELVYVSALKPKDSRILFNFGLLLYQIREYTSAETKLRKLLESDPFHLDANLLLASVYEEKGQFGKAVEYCMRAYEINSFDPRVLYRLGRAWDMAAETEKAIQYYRLFLSSSSEKEDGLKPAVRDRLDYLTSRKEEK